MDGLESLDPAARIVGPSSDFSRIPYHLYTDPAVFDLEQERIFRGPTWSYLGFENEVREPGDYITGYVGTTPYVLTRDKDGALHAFVNRCAHRGVAVVRNLRGNARNFTCIYHQWCYALNGDLIGVPLMKGMGGVGGYPDDFSVDGHGLRKLKIETISGIVFGTFSDAAPPLEDYLGPSICARLRMVCGRPIKVTGYHRHTMRANWKLFVENTRDMYHAPMLHPFLPVFGIVDTNMQATMEMNERGGLNSLLSGYRPPPGEAGPVRPRPSMGLVLEEPSVAVGVPEFPDGLAISIISIFPSCLFTLPGNTFSVRQIRPKSVDEVETLYTWYAFEDDDEEMLQRRRMQNNLFGPAGYVAMEDAEAMELIQQRISDGALEGRALLEFGGRGTEDRIDHLFSEGAIRAFWKGYCDIMDIPVSDGSAAA